MNNKMIFIKNFVMNYFLPVGVTRKYKIKNQIRHSSPCAKKVIGLLRGVKGGFLLNWELMMVLINLIHFFWSVS